MWKPVNASECPAEPVLRRTTPTVRRVGTVRLPIAGPYRPVARLYRFPDGRLLWHVRLWDVDHAVPHVVGTEVLIAFARGHRLPELEHAIVRLTRTALEEGRATD